MSDNVIFDERRDPFESLAPSEVELLGTGSVIISGAGVRWRRLPGPYSVAMRDYKSRWWNGHAEASTEDLYGQADGRGKGKKYWLVHDPSATMPCQTPAEPEGGARDDVWTEGCPATGCTRLWCWDPNPARRGWIHESGPK